MIVTKEDLPSLWSLASSTIQLKWVHKIHDIW